jgi:hypothetical protein
MAAADSIDRSTDSPDASAFVLLLLSLFVGAAGEPAG